MPKKNAKLQNRPSQAMKVKATYGSIAKQRSFSKSNKVSRKFRVLHVTGSNVSSFYESLSQIYGLPSFVNGPTEDFEHVVARVYTDPETDQTKWKFLNRSDVKDAENVKQQLSNQVALTHDQTISHIMNAVDADVVVPHMFCYPGYTSFRSLFDVLDIPYLGTAAEVQGILEDKWMARAIAVQDGCRMAKAQLLKENDISLVQIKGPVIVKPAREDNSHGVTHVKKRKNLQAALDEAFKWDEKVLVETFIPGREIRVAIVPQKVIDNIDLELKYKLPAFKYDSFPESCDSSVQSSTTIETDQRSQHSDELVVLPFLEYFFPEGSEIRTDAAKLNLDKNGQPIGQNTGAFKASKLPANVSNELSEELAKQAKLAFKAYDCRHYCVFDFRVTKDAKSGREIPYLLEACPSAGFSPQSIIVRMANTFAEIGGPDLQHPRLFTGVLKTSILESQKYKQRNLTDKNTPKNAFGMRKQ